MKRLQILNQSSIRLNNHISGLFFGLIKWLSFFGVLVFLGACSLPAYKLLADAEQGYQVVSSGTFKHLWVSNESYDLLNTENVPVMVFIEGDGVPWEAMNRIAFEPTPDEPLLLKWFLAANSPGVYLGRPCYFDLGDDACSAYWFTHGRYSEPVVTSLITVLKKKIHNRDIILVGHSGGAALAMLVAGHLKQVKAVVTIAGNLNVKAWVEHHRYSDLTGSLDPGAMPGLTCNIEQVHYYSSSDSVIQAKWLRAFSASQCNSSLIELPVKGHDQAWEEFQGLIMENLRSISTKLTQEK